MMPGLLRQHVVPGSPHRQPVHSQHHIKLDSVLKVMKQRTVEDGPLAHRLSIEPARTHIHSHTRSLLKHASRWHALRGTGG